MLPATGDGDDSEGKREKDPALPARGEKGGEIQNSNSAKTGLEGGPTRL
jgi:hypothetical protein